MAAVVTVLGSSNTDMVVPVPHILHLAWLADPSLSTPGW